MIFLKWRTLLALRFWAVVFGVVSGVLLAGGYGYYRVEARKIHDEQYQNLAAIAELKSAQILGWRKERLADAQRVAKGPVLRKDVAEMIRHTDSPYLRAQLQKILAVSREGGMYFNLSIFTPDARKLLEAREVSEPMDPATARALAAVLTSPDPLFSDFFRASDGRVYIDAVAAVRDDDGRPLAVVVLRNDAAACLYPLIQSWPLPSRSAETLLTRRDGEQVLFLNPLRYLSTPALSFHIPLTQSAHPAVQAALGHRGVFDGEDYRHVKVLADLRPIEGTAWFMVTKMDADEILFEARYRAYVTSLVVLAFIALLAALIAAVHRRQQAWIYRELFESERQKRLSQEQYRTTLYSIGDGIITTDTHSLVREMNRVAEALTGWTEAQARGKPLEEIFNIINQETRAKVPNPVNTVLREGVVVGLANHTVLVARDGSERAIADSAAPICDENGTISGVVLVFSDITEKYKAEAALRASEARFRSLLKNVSSVAIKSFNTDGIIQYWNQASEQLFGYTEAEVLGRDIHDLIVPPEIRQEAEQLSKTLALTGEPAPLKEFSLMRKDGSRVNVISSMSLVRTPDRPGEIFCFDIDITERKRLEAQLLRTQRMESIGTLASGVAHDLNNVLAPIILSSDLLRQESNPAARASLVDTIETCAQRGANIVSQVITFARGAKGEKTTLQLRHLVNEMEKIIHETFPRNIAITNQIPGDLWPVKANPTQIHQVLLNLCINARDAMPYGGTLQLRAQNQEIDAPSAASMPEATPGRYVVLEIADSGTGIAPEVIGKIFDPFFTTKDVGKGTGLGLSTVVGIVRGHEGFVTVHSEKGRGTTFKVFLPADKQGVVNPPQEPTVRRQGSGETILIVDDDLPVCQSILSVLELNGYKVLAAADAPEAISLYERRAEEIQLVLTDVSMPSMDGAELIRALQKIKPQLKVIASTGRATEESMAKLCECGVKMILQKPYDAGKLLAAVAAMLKG